MPAKKRIQKQDILAAAAEVIRKGGASSLSMRNIAKELGCSTQPLYSEFGSQEQLYEALPGYLRQEYLSVPQGGYRDFGRAFLRFAGKEPELFRFLYLRRRAPEETRMEDVNLERTLDLLVDSLEMDREQAGEMQRQMQHFCYGLGTMIATGYRTMDQAEIDGELTVFFALLLRHYKHASDETTLAYWMERSRNPKLG